MLIIMKKCADDAALDHIKEVLVTKGFDFHQSTGVKQVIIGVIGETDTLNIQELESIKGVLQVVRIMKEDECCVKIP